MVRGIVRTSQQEWESGTQALLIEAAVLGLSLFQESSFPPSSGLFLFSSLPSFLQQIFIEHCIGYQLPGNKPPPTSVDKNDPQFRVHDCAGWRAPLSHSVLWPWVGCLTWLQTAGGPWQPKVQHGLTRVGRLCLTRAGSQGASVLHGLSLSGTALPRGLSEDQNCLLLSSKRVSQKLPGL